MSSFRTTLPDYHAPFQLSHHQSITCFGSCFAQHMAKRFADAKFDCTLNPFGIQYNPLNISACIQMILDDYQFSERDLVQQDSYWYSLWHHSTFFHSDPQVLIEQLQKSLEIAKKKLLSTEVFVFTFGTAYYYQHKATKIIAANCHKLSSNQFDKHRISNKNIVEQFSSSLLRLKEISPDAYFIFTVSPIRHAKDGLIENTRSKANLILSIDTLLEQFPQASYFPSFELLMDDLRDYRFYEKDMLHPTGTAIDYIWNHFTKHLFSADTQALLAEIRRIQQAMEHRPFHVESEAHQKFLRNTLTKMEQLVQKNSLLNFKEERKIVADQLV